MDFYIEGVHCAACLWLVERLSVLAPGVESTSLDIARSVARVKIRPNSSFAVAARTLDELGYKPHPIERNEEAEILQRKENREWLLRMGIAGACAGNIMLMAVPLYSGVDGQLAGWFRWLSLFLFLPVVFFSATPFYKTAWTSIRSKTMSIDLPIALAIIFGSAASIAHLLSGSDHLYFDSLSALVFLLLASRFVLRRLQQNAFQSSHLLQFLVPSSAKRVDPESRSIDEVSVNALQLGDIISVSSSEVVPVDGVIQKGISAINCALLTGESTPKAVEVGDSVFAGTLNEEGSLEIKVTALGAQSRLGQILRQIESGAIKKAKIVTAADRIAKWFLFSVFASAGAVIWLSSSLSEGFSRALALVIVTCPCALALATPLSMSLSLGRASRKGILIKGAEALEKIAIAQNIVFDKTGTLTRGNFEVTSFSIDPSIPRLKEFVFALESRSKHPVAKAVVKWLRNEITNTAIAVENFSEKIGQGVSGTIDGKHIALKPLREAKGTAVGIYCDEILVGDIHLGDKLRPDSFECVRKLEKSGIKPFILSGDNRHAVEWIASQLGIPTARALACADPEAKKNFIEACEKSIMIGDGANDALALSAAYVGVAVHGSMEVSLRAADVYLSNPGLEPVTELISIAKETMRTIHRNFAFSLLYNLVGGVAAVTGHVTPLFAALLMPLSAFTVFGSSLLGSRRERL